MTKQEIIDSGISSLSNLIDFIRKPISSYKDEPHKFKGVIDGRKKAFEIAHNHIIRIRQLEESLGIHNESDHRERLQDLVDSTDKLQREIKKVLELKINADESDDEKIKAIVESKDTSFNLLEQIFNTAETINQKLNDKEAFSKPLAKVDFATARVKNRQ